jgi:hypothetical protein
MCRGANGATADPNMAMRLHAGPAALFGAPKPVYIRGGQRVHSQLFSLLSSAINKLYLTASHSLLRDLTNFFIFEAKSHSFSFTDLEFSVNMQFKVALVALAASFVSAQIDLSQIPTCAVSQLQSVTR